MDESERLVEAYLKNIGFADVRYEPDGNVPPDFLGEGRVAVEVRRLNQNHDDGSGRGLRGLEEDAIPLWRRVRDHLTGLGPAPASGQSWYVSYRFSRPIPSWATLKKDLNARLKPFMVEPDPQPFETNLGRGFWLSVFRSPTPKPTFFRAGGNSDEQSGGWLIPEIESNLKHCIAEKSRKILSRRAKYPEWWLVLPDHIGCGLDAYDQKQFRDEVTVSGGGFDKVVLLDPQYASRAFQVYP